VLQIIFEVSNNEAEYEALFHGLHLAVSVGIKRLLVYINSLLVVQQVNKEWDVNKDTMDPYVAKIRKHVIRDNNVGMDVLLKLGYDRSNVPLGVFVHELHHPFVAKPPELFRLKCTSYHYIADTNSMHFKRNNPLVCRISARCNHGSTGSKQVYLARRQVHNHIQLTNF
jgi:hypothetical protein